MPFKNPAQFNPKARVMSFTVNAHLAGSGTVTVHKVPSGTAQDSGTALLSSTISTASGANTRSQGTLSTTAATVELAAGDSLQLVDSGTLTSLADLAVSFGL